MQFQVPQFIDVEDKIVGPLTLRQFLYVAAAVGISLLLFFIIQLWLWLILSVLVIGGAAALSFIKINGQPLMKIVFSALGFYWRPQTYVWQQEKQKAEKKPAGATADKREEEQGFSLENLVSGLALRKSWQNLQTGSSAPESAWRPKKGQEKYEMIRKITGDRQAARRVDYR